MPSSIQLDIARLVLAQRWGALATVQDGAPLASMVAYAPEPGLSGLLFFLSGLAQHTRSLLAEPRASLVVGAPDSGEGDPQLLPRASLLGRTAEVPREAADFAAAWAIYVARFPDAEMRLALADFRMFRFVAEEVRYVGGFARAVTLSGDELREAAAGLA